MIKTNCGKSFASLVGVVALVTGSIVTSTVRAAVLNIDTTGVTTYGEQGDPGNTVFTFDIGADSHVTGIGYDVNLTAFDPSYLSEITVGFTPSDPSLGGVFLAPAFDQDAPGSGNFTSGGIIDLVGQGLDFNVSDDGTLRLEFFESFTDAGVNPNGQFDSGTLSVQYDAVPEPSTWALLGLGIVGTGVVALRRRITA